MKKFLHPLIFLLFVIPLNLNAQCSVGETEVTIVVHTDNWGSEITWELTGPSGSPSYASGGPYTDGSEQHDEQTICVPENAELVFTINDSYGDGFCMGEGDGYYTVSVYGFIYAHGCDIGDSESTSFIAEPAPDVNARFESTNIYEYGVIGDNQITGTFSNQGNDTITSIDVNWRVDGGSINTYNISGISVETYDEYDFTHNTIWSNSTAHVTKNMEIWLSNPNGVTDEKTSNDSISLSDIYILSESVQTRVLIEHYTNAGCPPCASQNPVLEELTNTGDNHNKVAHIAYHTSGPGADPMYDFNNGYGQGSARASYYDISGVPTAVVSGNVYSGSPASITQALLDQESSKYGLFKVTPELTFTNDSLYADISLKALKGFSTGSIKVFVVLIEDMEYETAPGTNGEESFPNAMRYMLTGVEGEDIGLPNADQELNVECKMPYSSEIGHDVQFIIFVQDVTSKDVLMAYQIDEDFIPPRATFDPDDNTTNVKLDATLSVTFDELIRLLDDTEITDPDTLMFLRAENIDGNEVPFSTTIQEGKVITLTPTNSLEYEKTYYFGYKEYIEDFSDVAVKQDFITFTTEIATNISEFLNFDDLRIYPIPANEHVIIDMSLIGKKDVKVKIYNSSGQLVKLKDFGTSSEGYNNYRIELNKFNNGIYFISVNVGEETITKKIQITK